MTAFAEQTRAAAANLQHPWDARALDWPLSKESVVVEVGGFTGRWALQIVERYQPRLFVFEPQQWAARVCAEILGKYTTTLAYGLGTKDETVSMGAWETDGCSVLKDGDQQGELREIGAAFKTLGIKKIDLMLMNIEGYEYTLIPHMLSKGIAPARLMVQFHTFADPDGTKLPQIQELLAAHGYKLVWSYGVVLMAWVKQ